jgi:serine/threonine-protein kinase
LGHPAIVRVFDFGRTRHGDPFVVMEQLHGETLAQLLTRDSRLPAIRAVQIMLPIADALAAAHAKGVVHRDVKPDNVFLARDESGRLQPKLLDFGIALLIESHRKLTLDSSVLGTPDYMSPEQAQGRTDIDIRTDVWSYCVMLYELVTGRTPFTGSNYNALLFAISTLEPQPITDYAAGDRELWCLLDHGLRKTPEERWESIRALGEALALWLYDRGIREDACAASLKTTWLEAGLTGIRIELGPEPTSAHFRQRDETPPSGVSVAELPSARSATASGRAAAAAPGAPKRSKLNAFVALALVVVLASAVFLLLRPSLPPTPVASPALAAAVAKHDSLPVQSHTTARGTPGSPLAPRPADEAVAPTPIARGKKRVTSTGSAARPARELAPRAPIGPGAGTPLVEAPSETPQAPPPKRDEDFGF